MTNRNLNIILAAREQRYQNILEKTAEYPGKTLLSAKLNIPGPEKNGFYTETVFVLMCLVTEQHLKKNGVYIEQKTARPSVAGPEALYVLDGRSTSPEEIKTLLVTLEETDNLGRLFDLDIWHQGKQLERSELGLPPRLCFLCNEPATVCARERKHSLSEIQNFITQLIEQDKRLPS